MNQPRPYVLAVTALAGIGLLAGGLWSLTAPRSFAESVNFPFNEHFEHDLGAFQIGIAATLLLALLWSDALATALAAFVVGNTVHAGNHLADLDIGGHAYEPWLLAAFSVAAAAAFWSRLRQIGHILGSVNPATTAELAPFVRQKTVRLTTYRKDGTPVATPVSIAVDGEHAYVRSFEKAGKTRRLRRNPDALLAPSTGRGRATGPDLPVQLRQVSGAEYQRAARLLATKQPLLHGVIVPLGHRAFRGKAGRTVHFRLTPGTAGTGRTGGTATSVGSPELLETRPTAPC